MPGPLQKAVPDLVARERELRKQALLKAHPSQGQNFDFGAGRMNRMAAHERQALDQESDQHDRMAHALADMRGMRDRRLSLEERMRQQADFAQRQKQTLDQREAELREMAARPQIDVGALEGTKNAGASKSPWEAWKGARGR